MDFDDAMMEMILYPWLDDPSLVEEFDEEWLPNYNEMEDDEESVTDFEGED